MAKPQPSLATPLTPRTERREENAAARTKFGPAAAAIRGQQRASGQQQKNIGNWYDQYKADLADSYAKTAASYADAANTISSGRDSAAAADTARQGQLAQEAQSSASQRGAKTDIGVSARAAQASSANTISANRDLAQVASTGAAQRTFAAGRIPVAGAQAVQAHQQESGRRRTIDQSLTSLKGQQADFRLDYRAQARKDAFNNKIAEQAGLIKQQVANTGTKNADTNAIRAGEQARHNAVTEATANYNAATGRQRANALGKLNAANTNLIAYQLKHHLGPAANKAALTPSQKLATKRDRAQQANHTGPYAGAKPAKKPYTAATTRTARNQFNFAGTRLRTAPNVKGQSNGALIDLLVAEHIPRDIARAAVEQRAFGHLPAATQRGLRNRYGLNIGAPQPGRGTH